MALSPSNMERIRGNARAIGLLFQALAILTFAATIYGSVETAHLGTTIGVNAAHDPVAWFVFAGGSFVALMFTGIGHVLGLLCAIYDRQDRIEERAPSISGVVTQGGPLTLRTATSGTVWDYVVARDETLGSDLPGSLPATATTEDPGAASGTLASARPDTLTEPVKGSGLWDWLSKERHLKNSGQE